MTETRRYLMDEHPHSFYPTLAERIWLNERRPWDEPRPVDWQKALQGVVRPGAAVMLFSCEVPLDTDTETVL